MRNGDENEMIVLSFTVNYQFIDFEYFDAIIIFFVALEPYAI